MRFVLSWAPPIILVGALLLSCYHVTHHPRASDASPRRHGFADCAEKPVSLGVDLSCCNWIPDERDAGTYRCAWNASCAYERAMAVPCPAGEHRELLDPETVACVPDDLY